MIGRLIKAVLIAAVLALVIESLPDIKRYLELREMLPVRARKGVMGVEVVLGFAFGYWVGTRPGRKGMLQAIDAAQAIWASPETRRMLAEGLSAFQEVAPALGPMGGNGGSRTSVIGSVMDELIERRQRRAA
jgi:galactitol-specific phosphotransferase system IIC component